LNIFLTRCRVAYALIRLADITLSEDVRVVRRKRTGAALISSRARGVVRNEGEIDGLKVWVVA
jgi:hypothetical protein